MTSRPLCFAALICLVPAVSFAQTATRALPHLSTSIFEQSSKITLDRTPEVSNFTAVTMSQPAPASDKKSHWGVSASFTPKWKIWSKVVDAIADEGETWNIEGQQFSIGLAHGRSMGGDFGVDYVAQRVKDGSTVQSTEQQCYGQNNTAPCFNVHSQDVTNNVLMKGVKVHFFIPFATIKRRVQAGINIGVGVAKISGNDVESEDQVNFVPNPPPQQNGVYKKTTVNQTENIKDVIDLPVIPLFDFDVAVAFIVTPAIKIRYMGGIGIPGAKKFQIMGTYLFGAH